MYQITATRRRIEPGASWACAFAGVLKHTTEACLFKVVIPALTIILWLPNLALLQYFVKMIVFTKTSLQLFLVLQSNVPAIQGGLTGFHSMPAW